MRLIDAYTVISVAEGEFSEEDVSKIRWLINHIVTAYDIDKIVEELENECISPNDYPGYVVDLEKAIEIVKQGVR